MTAILGGNAQKAWQNALQSMSYRKKNPQRALARWGLGIPFLVDCEAQIAPGRRPCEALAMRLEAILQSRRKDPFLKSAIIGCVLCWERFQSILTVIEVVAYSCYEMWRHCVGQAPYPFVVQVLA